MKNIKVLLSCDDNPYYYEFWNDVSYVWKNILQIDPVLIYISNNKNDYLSENNGTIIPIKKIDNFPIHLQAQLARVYFAKNFSNDICLMSDIDMMPVSKQFFNKEKIINNIIDDSFFHLNPTPREFGQLPMCYYAAYGKTYDNIVNNKSWYDFLNYIIEKDFNAEKLGYHLPDHLKDKKLWFSDELFLYSEILLKNIKIIKNNKIISNNERLDREMLLKYSGNISNTFVDCHMPRPYGLYYRQINYLVHKLENNE